MKLVNFNTENKSELPVMQCFNYLYIDPGSGSYLVQVIAAAVVGIAFFFAISKCISGHFLPALKKPKDNPPALMSNTAIHHPSSYRDPSGFIFENDVLYRQVNISFKEHFDHFIRVALRKLVKKWIANSP